MTAEAGLPELRLDDPALALDPYPVYAALREADDLELTRVIVVPPDDAGIGAAVCDRIRRAAAR